MCPAPMIPYVVMRGGTERRPDVFLPIQRPGFAVPRLRRSRVDPRLDPELRRAGEEIQAQIDAGRSGLLR